MRMHDCHRPHRNIKKPHNHASATAGDRFEHSAGHAVLSSTSRTTASRRKAIVESADPVSPSANTAQLGQTIRLTAPNHAVQAPTYHRPLPSPIQGEMTEFLHLAIRPKAPLRAAPPLCAHATQTPCSRGQTAPFGPHYHAARNTLPQ
ncbi:hypothetical protein VE02_04889 [Pseudogymnoascus sp. 03VT05]|nr:hypothetical protein VE02_04889 [Pseudogymnoascus sp. 03VT05]